MQNIVILISRLLIPGEHWNTDYSHIICKVYMSFVLVIKLFYQTYSYFFLFFVFLQKPLCSQGAKSVKPESHSPSHKELPCFMALLPNITCLQCRDMILDKARKYRNKSHSPPSLGCSFREMNRMGNTLKFGFQAIVTGRMNERKSSLIFTLGGKNRVHSFKRYQRRSESLRCPCCIQLL